MPGGQILGTETEYGIAVRSDPEFNPALGSAMIINSYPGPRVRVQWSYEEETPGRDARGFGHDGYGVADPEGTLINAVLGNGARLYVDHAHPEYSGPECRDPLQAALYDKVGERVMHRAATEATQRLGGSRMALYKNNSDGKGNSYGAHENYLLSRATPFGDVIRYAMTFFVTRQLYTGAGKVGAENGRPDADFQLTQRADFFEEEVGLETTLKRPIINTRDEPHGDSSKYRRLHVIVGDATLSEVQTFLKLGATSLFLQALEDGALPDPLDLADPVTACWNVSHDMTFRAPLEMEGGFTATALEVQWRYLEWLTKYVERDLDEPVWRRVLDEWEAVLTDLEQDPDRLSDRLDWATKLSLFRRYQDRDGLAWNSPKMRALGLQFHDVDPERGLYHRMVRRGVVRRLFDDEQIAAAESTPPDDTRAYFRGRCVTQFPDSLVAANWDSLVFDVGESHLRRVPMMEPGRGTKTLVGPLLDDIDEAADLIARLSEGD